MYGNNSFTSFITNGSKKIFNHNILKPHSFPRLQLHEIIEKVPTFFQQTKYDSNKESDEQNSNKTTEPEFESWLENIMEFNHLSVKTKIDNTIHNFSLENLNASDNYDIHIDTKYANFTNFISKIISKEQIIITQFVDLKIDTPKEKNYGNCFLIDLFKSENSKRITEGIFPIEYGLEEYIKNIPCFEISEPPKIIPSDNCVNCNYHFTIFRSKYCCRNCGKQFCSKCITSSTIPKLGYYFLVPICDHCKKHNEKTKQLEWVDFAINTHNADDIPKILHISTTYKTSNPIYLDRIKNAGNIFFERLQYEYALQCYSYCFDKIEQWFSVMENLVQKEKYDILRKSIMICYDKYKLEQKKWIELANIYLQKATTEKIEFGIIAILFYEQGKMDPFLISNIIPRINKINEWLGKLFLAYIVEKTKEKKNLEDIAKKFFNEGLYNFAFYLFELVGYAEIEWNMIIEKLCDFGKFEIAAKILENKIKRSKIPEEAIDSYLEFDPESYSKYFHIIEEIEMPQLIEHLLFLIKENKETKYCLAFVFRKNKSCFMEFSIYYFSQKIYDVAYLCMKIDYKLHNR